MKTSEEYRELSKARLLTAQHILDITYPALKSPRLFLSALEHLFLSMDYAMNSILASEKMRMIAGNFPQTFSGRYSAFRLRVADKMGFSKIEVETLLTIRNILLAHQSSPTEFERGEKFIICDDDFKMTILSVDVLTHYAKAVSSFNEHASRLHEQPLSTERVSLS